ncbi:MAG: hypothetical protein H6508_04135 [Calditrichaeota bacterium]|nr:hypothetical protein [Calditrichota bacterium]MCB9366357.1 hypothetical protein [Calditrichota bacterium]
MLNRNGKALPLILLICLVLLIAAAYWYWGRGPEYSLDTLRSTRAELRSHDLKFLSRGRDFACYTVTLASMTGDTVHAVYRLPASEQRVKTLLLFYDQAEDVNIRELLDDMPKANLAAVMACNIRQFSPVNGSQDSRYSRTQLWRQLDATRKGLDVLLQFARKHHVVDTSMVCVAASEFADLPLALCLKDLPFPVAAAAFVDFQKSANEWADKAPSALRDINTLLEVPSSLDVVLVEASKSHDNDLLSLMHAQRIELRPESGESLLKSGTRAVLDWMIGDVEEVARPAAVPDSSTLRTLQMGR